MQNNLCSFVCLFLVKESWLAFKSYCWHTFRVVKLDTRQMLFVAARIFLISRIDRLICGTVGIQTLDTRLKFNHSMNLIRLLATTRPSNNNYLHPSTQQFLQIAINKFQTSNKVRKNSKRNQTNNFEQIQMILLSFCEVKKKLISVIRLR